MATPKRKRPPGPPGELRQMDAAARATMEERLRRVQRDLAEAVLMLEAYVPGRFLERELRNELHGLRCAAGDGMQAAQRARDARRSAAAAREGVAVTTRLSREDALAEVTGRLVNLVDKMEARMAAVGMDDVLALLVSAVRAEARALIGGPR